MIVKINCPNLGDVERDADEDLVLIQTDRGAILSTSCICGEQHDLASFVDSDAVKDEEKVVTDLVKMSEQERTNNFLNDVLIDLCLCLDTDGYARFIGKFTDEINEFYKHFKKKVDEG